MDRDLNDAPFKTWFRELRADNERHAPPASRLLDAAGARKQEERTRGWPFRAAIAGLAALILLIFFWGGAPPARRRAPAIELLQWQSPTKQLLHPFDEELLSGTLRLGPPWAANDVDTKN